MKSYSYKKSQDTDSEPSLQYSAFEVSGCVCHKNNTNLGCGYKEEFNRKSGQKIRSCKFYLFTHDKRMIPIKLYAYENNKKMFDLVLYFYEHVPEQAKIVCKGSIKYPRDNTVEFVLYRYWKNDKEENINIVYQPIVFNKTIGNMLSAYIMKGKDNLYIIYDYKTEFKRPTTLQRGDFIVAQGYIDMQLNIERSLETKESLITIVSFVKGTWHRQLYNVSIFKDDAVRNIFKGTDPDLKNIVEPELED